MQQTQSPSPVVNKPPLPDLFAWPDGRRVSSPTDWPARARAWRDLIVELEYGGLPPAPESLEVERLCTHVSHRWPWPVRHDTLRIHCRGGERPFAFGAHLYVREGCENVPVVINGDLCWTYMDPERIGQTLSAGCLLVTFDRTELAADVGSVYREAFVRSGGLYDVYPGLSFGALSAWAWGYHRVVDALERLRVGDRSQIAITGHSRGAKTVLLAAATDERIALVNDNASCAGGSPVYRYVGAGGETLEKILDAFPYWFGPRLADYAGREEALPFDQHALLACMAPRWILLTFALGDRWSNPEGMVQSWRAAREVYRFLGVPNRLAFHLRQGVHEHTAADWQVLLDFIGQQWLGRLAEANYNEHPYPDLTPMFDWSAPSPGSSRLCA